MEKIEITLAGQTYLVGKLPYGRSKQWREKHGKVVEELLAGLSDFMPLLEQLENIDDWKQLPLPELLGIVVNRFDVVSKLLLDAPDLAFEALCDYSEEIKKDKERIEEEAFDDELVGGFLEVLKIIYPLATMLVDLAGGEATGRAEDETEKKSHSPNGESPASTTSETSNSTNS